MKFSIEGIEAIAHSYLVSNKIANTSFSDTYNNIVGLLDKIGLIKYIDTDFQDKLVELNGENLPYGKTIEEWYQDLIEAIDYNQDTDGSRALKFYSPTYRPVAYSYDLGTKTIPLSIPNNKVESGVNNYEQLSSILATMTKRIGDSTAQWRYAVKRELLGVLCDKAVAAYADATAYADYSDTPTNVAEGTFYKQGTPAKYAVCVKAKTAASGDTWATLVAAGYLIEIHFVQTLAKPTDTSTGEAFLKALKDCVEKAQDISEGYSFNGNTIGAERGLSLYFKQGFKSSLDVDTLAGAFHEEKLSVGVEAKVIKDFGKTTSKAYAILMDTRACKHHISYEATRDNMNGAGDFLNLFHHIDSTCFISRNAFITIFVEP